jgi:hypothetical protein
MAIRMPTVAPESQHAVRNASAELAHKFQDLRLHAQLAATKLQEVLQPVKVDVCESLWCTACASRAVFISIQHFLGRLGSVHTRFVSEFQNHIAQQ